MSDTTNGPTSPAGGAVAPRRGWSSGNLPVVSTDDPNFWSVADASSLLGPPDLSEAQVRQLVRLAGLEPVGKRNAGSRRRHVRVYPAAAFIQAFEKIATIIAT
jgi:hypothetical protein